MGELDKGSQNNGLNVESKAGEHGPLSSNKANVCSPALDVKSTDFSEDMHNLVGVFSLLLKVDKRINPQNYQHSNATNESNNSGSSF